MRIVLPIRTRSEANRREHWAAKAKRAKEQRGVAAMLVRRAYNASGARKPDASGALTLRGKAVLSEPVTITLTRIAPRKLDSGNLEASFKAVQDGVADALGIDDGDERLTWVYGQLKGDPKEYEVWVDVEIREEGM